MQHLNWPMITVPPAIAFSKIKKIGIACDLDEVEKKMPVEAVTRLVKDFNAELHILNTGNEKTYDPDIIFEAGEVHRLLKDLKPVFHLIAHDNEDEGTLEFAEKNQIDLLVVVPGKHGFFERLTHKSHTRQFVLHSYVPVMAIHHANN